MEVKAIGRHIRMSPQKARLVADMIRGKDVREAISILAFSKKRSAHSIDKILKSAIANAKAKKTIDVDTLYVKTIFIDGGPILKRFMPRAMGRASLIKKRTSHITVVLDES